jgi:hypothetical protein
MHKRQGRQQPAALSVGLRSQLRKRTFRFAPNNHHSAAAFDSSEAKVILSPQASTLFDLSFIVVVHWFDHAHMFGIGEKRWRNDECFILPRPRSP